ncbi:MAG: hypothetical protein HYV09_20795 [Deltaproteobacteria bacterium]|nr:hypothetical protein [Deltaproteobacteria bacterium]
MKAAAGSALESADRVRKIAMQHGLSPEQVLVGGFPGMRDMSDVLIEWAAPLLEPLKDASMQGFQNAVSLASFIWNAASRPERTAPEVAAAIVQRLREIDASLGDGLLPMIEQLVTGRRRDYATDPRRIWKAEVLERGSVRWVDVVPAAPRSTREGAARSS